MNITDRAIEIFRLLMVAIDKGDKKQRFKLDQELHDELRLKPWEGLPTIVLPHEKNDVYPPSAAGYLWHPRGQRLYFELCRLSGISPYEREGSPSI
jgi:hypothetical protein